MNTFKFSAIILSCAAIFADASVTAPATPSDAASPAGLVGHAKAPAKPGSEAHTLDATAAEVSESVL